MAQHAVSDDRTSLRAVVAGGVVQRMLAHHLLVGLTSLYVLLGVIHTLLIPPWQSPDEPAHFEYARGLLAGNAVDEVPAVQGPIIESFYTFRFWQFRGLLPPETVPSSFTTSPALIIRQNVKAPGYYWLVGIASSWTDSTLLQLYSMRWVSVLLSAWTVPLVFAIAREVVPVGRLAPAYAAATMVALLPQYGYIGSSVTPDAIGAPVAAAAVWFGVRALGGKRVAVSVLALLVLTVLAFWLRRNVIASVPWALLVALACFYQWATKRVRPSVVLGSVAVILVAAAVVISRPSQTASAWYPQAPIWGATQTHQAAHTGSSSLRIVQTQADTTAILTQSVLSYDVSSLAGRRVTLQGYVRSATGSVPGTMTLIIDERIRRTTPFTATNTWQPVAVTYTIPRITTQIRVEVNTSGVGELLVDDISLDSPDIPDAEKVLPLSNGGAETALLWWQKRYPTNQVVEYLSRGIQAVFDGAYVAPKAFALYPAFLWNIFTSFVGRFGWMTFGFDDTLYRAITLVWSILCGAALVALWPGRSLDPGRRRALGWLLLLLILAVSTTLVEYIPYLNVRVFPQGRYLFPVLGPIAALLASGIAQLVPRRYDRQIAFGVMVASVALYMWAWWGVIVPRFYG